ncbi:MAG: hypothetical protein ACT6FG_00065 [Methanosarcinaceae archaeon]
MDEISILAMMITAVLGALSLFYGTKYLSVKSALNEIVDALEDDTITKEEFVKIVLAIKKIFY